MRQYQIKFTRQAREQMYDTVRYLSKELASPQTAYHWVEKIEHVVSSLAQFPNRVPLTEEEPWRSQGIRKMPVQNFLVYFWVDEEHLRVQITAVIYGKRDQLRALSQMNLKP